MRYEGNTLHEALGKALGTRDQYRRKIVRRHHQTKQYQEHLSTSDQLQPLRSIAIDRAKAYLARANYDFGSPEDGYAEIFLIDLQEVIELPGSECGRAVTSRNGTPQWQYDFGQYSAHPFFVLVFGHSHPDDSRNPSDEDMRRLCRPSYRVPGASSSDRDLYPYAPVVIGCRNRVREWNRNGRFRQWDR